MTKGINSIQFNSSNLKCTIRGLTRLNTDTDIRLVNPTSHLERVYCQKSTDSRDSPYHPQSSVEFWSINSNRNFLNIFGTFQLL